MRTAEKGPTTAVVAPDKVKVVAVEPKPPSAPAGAGGNTMATKAAVTVEGSKRAKGWHSAVGDAMDDASPLGSKTASARGISAVPRRPSVQFSEETLDGAASRPVKPRTGQKDDGAFRQNMTDFLTVMYGDGASSTAGEGKSIPLTPKLRGSAPPPPAVAKGPLVKSVPATAATPGMYGGDRIDTLVDSLARAYSRRTTPNGAEMQGAAPLEDNPFESKRTGNYRRAVASPRLSIRSTNADAADVSVFVSQALDSFIGPNGLRAPKMTSTRSVLSSLGLDDNFMKLLSFGTSSNLRRDEEEEETVMEPMYIGEQAMFQSVGNRRQNEISVSKTMRGHFPPPLPNESSIPAATAAAAGKGRSAAFNTNNTGLSLDSGEVKRTARGGGPSVSPPRATARRAMNEKSIACGASLDSRALGFGAAQKDDSDDSWADVDKRDAQLNAGANPVVSTTRALLDYSKNKGTMTKAMSDLMEEEQLKRNVAMAVEQQLRGYIISIDEEGKAKLKSGTIAAKTKPNSSAPAQRGSTSGASGAAAAPKTSPATLQNVIDFFGGTTAPKEKSVSPVKHPSASGKGNGGVSPPATKRASVPRATGKS